MTIHESVNLARHTEPQLAPATSVARHSPTKSLRVALISEGSYPFHPGGVSMWCHQLIEGMPEHSFTVVALTVDGTESSTWATLDNLTKVVNIPLWGARPRRSDHRRPPPPSFAEIHYAFLRAMIGQQEPQGGYTLGTGGVFFSALRGMFEYAQTRDLGAALARDDAVDRLQRVWHEKGTSGRVGMLTLHDALVVTDRIEHMLRPLSHPPVMADVCHLAMNGISALVAMASKWSYNAPMVMSEHGVYLRERYLGLTKETVSHPVKVIMMGFCRALASAAYINSDILTPHSSYNRRWQLYNGAEPHRIQTMYNGIDPADFPIAHGEPDCPTIVFVGRIDPLKDLHTLIRAFAIVREKIPNARLRMFGPVTTENVGYHASCVQLVEELGLSDSAAFEGRVPKQVDAYGAGHLVALTSVSEGFPYTVVESMSTGRPQVCTNVGGVSEAVGDAGFVVPPRDHAAVAEACIRLLNDAELRSRLGLLARQRVLDKFTLNQWTGAYLDIYHELGSGKRRDLVNMTTDGATPHEPRVAS
ncbi:MAG: GT4 family glycosyltransferase PelF [Pseudonocardiaceae bacterium]